MADDQQLLEQLRLIQAENAETGIDLACGQAINRIEFLENQWEKAQDAVRFAEEQYERQAAVLEALTSDETIEAVARIPWDNDFPGAWDKGVDPEDEEERDPRPQARADVQSCIQAALQHAQEQAGVPMAERFTISRYDASSQLLCCFAVLDEEEAVELIKLATGYPMGGYRNGLLRKKRRSIFHLPAPHGYDSVQTQTLISELEEGGDDG